LGGNFVQINPGKEIKGPQDMGGMLFSDFLKNREIGLRKALRVRKKDILYIFLIESVVLTAIGSVIGIILGIVFSYLASLILIQQLSSAWVFTISLPAIFLGLGVASFVGLVFGLYPKKSFSLKSN